MLSMSVLFDASVVAERDAAVIAMIIDGQRFVVAEADGSGHLDVRRADAATSAAATLTSSTNVLASMLYDGRALADAEAHGEATITGNRAAVQRFMSSVASPPTRASDD